MSGHPGHGRKDPLVFNFRLQAGELTGSGNIKVHREIHRWILLVQDNKANPIITTKIKRRKCDGYFKFCSHMFQQVGSILGSGCFEAAPDTFTDGVCGLLATTVPAPDAGTRL